MAWKSLLQDTHWGWGRSKLGTCLDLGLYRVPGDLGAHRACMETCILQKRPDDQCNGHVVVTCMH